MVVGQVKPFGNPGIKEEFQRNRFIDVIREAVVNIEKKIRTDKTIMIAASLNATVRTVGDEVVAAVEIEVQRNRTQDVLAALPFNRLPAEWMFVVGQSGEAHQRQRKCAG